MDVLSSLLILTNSKLPWEEENTSAKSQVPLQEALDKIAKLQEENAKIIAKLRELERVYCHN
jgi:hypothetical protein